MADDLKLKVLKFSNGTGAVGTTWTASLSGFGTPVAYIIVQVEDTTVSGRDVNTDNRMSIGIGDGTTERCASYMAQQSAVNSSRQFANDVSVLLLDDAGNTDHAHKFSALVTDGVEFEVVNTTGTADFGFIILIQARHAKVLDVDNTGGTATPDFGFRMTTLFGIGTGSTLGGESAASSDHGNIFWGWAHNHPTKGIQQISGSYAFKDGIATSEAAKVTSSDHMGRDIDPTGPTLNGGWDITAFNVNDESVDVSQISADGMIGAMLGLDIGEGQCDIGLVASPTSTGTKAETGIGFQCTALLWLATRSASGSWNALSTSGNASIFGMGGASEASATPSTTEQMAVFSFNEDASTSAACGNMGAEGFMFSIGQNAGSVTSTDSMSGEARAFESDGFTVNWVHTDTGSARQHGYIAFLDAVGVQPGEHLKTRINTLVRM